MSKIFITGINGFVGRNLARHLRESGHEVGGTARLADEAPGAVACDIKRLDEIRRAVLQFRPEIIVHTAALSSVTEGGVLDYYQTNVLGTENLLQVTNELNERIRFIYVSTAGVYGNQDIGVLHEALSPKPVSHYGISKFAGECLVQADFGKSHDVTIVRPFNIVGLGQKMNFIFPKIVHHFKNKLETIRLGNLDPKRDYLHIDNCCRYIAQLIFNPAAHGEVVNLCANRGTSVRELLNILSEITSHEIKVELAPEFVRKNEVWSLLGSDEKLKALCVDEVELIPVEEILSQMLNSSK